MGWGVEGGGGAGGGGEEPRAGERAEGGDWKLNCRAIILYALHTTHTAETAVGHVHGLFGWLWAGRCWQQGGLLFGLLIPRWHLLPFWKFVCRCGRMALYCPCCPKQITSKSTISLAAAGS